MLGHIVTNLLKTKDKFRTAKYEYGFANTKNGIERFFKIVFLYFKMRQVYRSGRNASWAKLAKGETRVFLGIHICSFDGHSQNAELSETRSEIKSVV